MLPNSLRATLLLLITLLWRTQAASDTVIRKPGYCLMYDQISNEDTFMPKLIPVLNNTEAVSIVFKYRL
jgi:hypothetical protein